MNAQLYCQPYKIVLDTIIDDLVKVKHYCYQQHEDKVPTIARDNLVINSSLLQYFFARVIFEMDDLERSKLQKEHRELDYSAIDSHFYGMVNKMVERAVKEKEYEVNTVSEDNIHTISRALHYAKYCSETLPIPMPKMSPIQLNTKL
ncbi:hypothetical protein C7B80_11875 [Cyanosarcina cf. burmensis CCALA 770]|nr:hypothetical protein C7B80_11875 [Cyanosarcina cf. burmensis CCALA 770]